MLSFQGEHILSVNQLDRDCIERIFAVAKKMEPYAKKQKQTTVNNSKPKVKRRVRLES